MRVVIDTNVLISAALKEKSVPVLAVYLIEQRCILLKSTQTEQELLQVLARRIGEKTEDELTNNRFNKSSSIESRSLKAQT